MEIPGYGYFLPGDEFIEREPKKDRVLFGKVIRSHQNEDVLEIMWSRMRKTCFNDQFSYRAKDVAEDFDSLQRGLAGGQVKVLDRKFKQGDLVRIGDKVGEVVDINYICTALVHDTDEPNKVMLNLPDRQLRPIAKFAKGERIVLNGWLGIIQDLTWNAHLVSNEKERCTILFKNGIWAVNSFGTAKPYVMHRGQCIVLTKEQLKDIKWETEKKIHRFLWFIVSYVTLESISVNWIGQIPRTPEVPKPNCDLSSNLFNTIIQLESQSTPNRLFIGYCRYKKNPFEREILVVEKDNWMKSFAKEIYSKNKRLQNTKVIRILTGIESERRRSCSKPRKRSRKDKSSRSKSKHKSERHRSCSHSVDAQPQLNIDQIPDNCIVDVIFMQQMVHVKWENNQVHQILSRHLERVEPLRRPLSLFRSFVQSKTPGKMCGVAHFRDYAKALVRVQWYYRDHVTKDLFLDEAVQEESDFDIYPHPEYSPICIGTLVCRSAECTHRTFSCGIVRGIHRNGRVWCSPGEGRKRALLWPRDLQAVTHLFYFPHWGQPHRFEPRYTKCKTSLEKIVHVGYRDTIPPTQEDAYKNRYANQTQAVTIAGVNFPVFATMPTVKPVSDSNT